MNSTILVMPLSSRAPVSVEMARLKQPPRNGQYHQVRRSKRAWVVTHTNAPTRVPTQVQMTRLRTDPAAAWKSANDMPRLGAKRNPSAAPATPNRESHAHGSI